MDLRSTKGMFSKKSQRGCGAPRFHSHAGLNVKFESNHQTAVRTTSFANAITFSEKPLAPGEIFLIEIEETETGWSGHMRIGLTQLNPNTGFELPLYALPDLLSMGPCWLYAITKRNVSISNARDHYDGSAQQNEGANAPPRRYQRVSYDEEDPNSLDGEDSLDGLEPRVFENNPRIANLDSVDDAESSDFLAENVDENALNTDHQRRVNNDAVLRREGDVIWTPCGFIQHKALAGQNVTEGDSAQLPTDVGSRIGVMFVPTGDNAANMHFIINGEDQGPCSRDIPYQSGPVFAVVDVYGSTKRVRTCQIYGVDTLQSMCRDAILLSIHMSGVRNLPLPKLLKNYLLFH